MLIFVILSIAAMTRFDFSGSLSCSISIKTVGTTCHDTPNPSLSHPHCTSWPPADQRRELLPVELECHRHDRPLRSSGGLGPGVVVAGDARDPRILEDRDVKRRGLLGLMIEPQKRRDSLQRLWH